jgi:hypothetical protein
MMESRTQQAIRRSPSRTPPLLSPLVRLHNVSVAAFPEPSMTMTMKGMYKCEKLSGGGDEDARRMRDRRRWPRPG